MSETVKVKDLASDQAADIFSMTALSLEAGGVRVRSHFCLISEPIKSSLHEAQSSFHSNEPFYTLLQEYTYPPISTHTLRHITPAHICHSVTQTHILHTLRLTRPHTLSHSHLGHIHHTHVHTVHTLAKVSLKRFLLCSLSFLLPLSSNSLTWCLGPAPGNPSTMFSQYRSHITFSRK
jgi:hypothetical protein